MAIETKKHGFLFLASGAIVLFLTTLYFPYLYQNVPRYFELTWFVLLPFGLILFVLGVFRLGVAAALAMSKQLRQSSE